MDEVLSRLLRDVLGRPLAREHPRAAIERTASILAETAETAETAEIVGSALVLMPIDDPTGRPRRASFTPPGRRLATR